MNKTYLRSPLRPPASPSRPLVSAWLMIDDVARRETT
jgi:hypothetical protein